MRNPTKQRSKPATVLPTTTTAKNSEQAAGRRNASRSGKRKAGSKTERVLDLLSRAGGASILDLTSATDWLPHTTRAALTGLRKRGHTIQAERKEDGPTVYRLKLPASAKVSRRTSKSKTRA
jgi:hypothetical protein